MGYVLNQDGRHIGIQMAAISSFISTYLGFRAVRNLIVVYNICFRA